MWDKFNRCSNSLVLNTSVTEIGSSWCAEQGPPPSKASSSLPSVPHDCLLAVDVEEPRSCENSYFTPWGTFYLSISLGFTQGYWWPLFRLWPRGASWKLWEAEVTNHGPKLAKELPKLSCAGVRDKVTKFQGESLPSQKKLPILINSLTDIFLRLRNICIWRFH